eukprot:1615844-Rhodomonas_salina.1
MRGTEKEYDAMARAVLRKGMALGHARYRDGVCRYGIVLRKSMGLGRARLAVIASISLAAALMVWYPISLRCCYAMCGYGAGRRPETAGSENGCAGWLPRCAVLRKCIVLGAGSALGHRAGTEVLVGHGVGTELEHAARTKLRHSASTEVGYGAGSEVRYEAITEIGHGAGSDVRYEAITE